MSGASSMAFAYVYCNVAVKPLRRRRRNWICPASRVELPFDVKKIYPEGLIAPAGNVFGRNSCGSRVPFVPRYVAVICKAAGKSRCNDNIQFCAYPIRKFGSMAKVLGVTPWVVMNPFSSVSGLAGVFGTLRLLESGDCCAICTAMDWYTFVLR